MTDLLEKACLGCGETKPLTEFSPQNGSYTSRCKLCLAAARRERRARNPELDRKNERRWYGNGGGTRKCKTIAAQRNANPEAFRERERRNDANRCKVKRAQKEARRRAKRRSVTIAPFTVEQLTARLSMWSGCWLCGGEWEAVDHVKPLSRGGAHCLANFRPACKPCNSWKHNKWQGAAWAAGLERSR